MATSDVHNQLTSFDYLTDRPTPRAGLALLANHIADLRADNVASVLLDNGDFSQGGLLLDAPPVAGGAAWLHPAVRAMNALNYDAASLGNHEFDRGLRALADVRAGADFPFVSTNVAPRAGVDLGGICQPVAWITREIALSEDTVAPLRIAVIGLVPEEIMVWNKAQVDAALTVRPMAETATVWAQKLRQEGADLVICLAHAGLEGPDGQRADLGSVVDVAAGAEVDVIVAGHSHLIFPDGLAYECRAIESQTGHVHGVPVVQPGVFASHLGVVDLTLKHDLESGWTVVGSRVRLLPAGTATAKLSAPRSMLCDHLAQAHEATRAEFARPVGRTDIALCSSASLLADTAVRRLVGQAKITYLRETLTDEQRAGRPIVALVPSFRVGGRDGADNYTRIAPGVLRQGDLHAIYPYANRLIAGVMTVGQLALMLEEGFDVFQQLVAGRADQMIMNPVRGGAGLSAAVGASYQIDLSAPWGQRLRDLRIGGEALGSDAEVIIASSEFGAHRGGVEYRELTLPETRCNREILQDFIARVPSVNRAVVGEAAWGFVPVVGASVLFDTSPCALRDLLDAGWRAVETLGEVSEGVMRFRLRF